MSKKFREYYLVNVGSEMAYLVICEDERHGTVVEYGFCHMAYDGVFIPKDGMIHSGRGRKGETGSYVSADKAASLFDQLSDAGGFFNAGISFFWGPGPRGSQLFEWLFDGPISVASDAEDTRRISCSGSYLPELYILGCGAEAVRVDPHGFSLYYPKSEHRWLRVSKDGWYWVK